MFLQNWGATPDETDGPVVGDGLCPEARVVATRCITLAAPPDQVYPWLRQMGFRRAGWYSYDWLDNLGRRSATHVHPEWQDVVTGSRVPAGPMSFEAAIVEPPRAFVLRVGSSETPSRRLQFVLAFELRKIPQGTRLVTRVRIRVDVPGGRLVERLLGTGDGVMVRKQLLNIARRIDHRL
jgi:proline iminopeptidase